MKHTEFADGLGKDILDIIFLWRRPNFTEPLTYTNSKKSLVWLATNPLDIKWTHNQKLVGDM